MYPIPFPSQKIILTNPNPDELVDYFIRSSGLRGHTGTLRESDFTTITTISIGMKLRAAITRIAELLWVGPEPLKNLMEQDPFIIVTSSPDDTVQGYVALQHTSNDDGLTARIVDVGAPVIDTVHINKTVLRELAKRLLEHAKVHQEHVESLLHPSRKNEPKRELPVVDCSPLTIKLPVAEVQKMRLELLRLVSALTVIANAKPEYGYNFPEFQSSLQTQLTNLFKQRQGHSIVRALGEWQHLSQIHSASNGPNDYRWAKATAKTMVSILSAVFSALQKSGDTFLPAFTEVDFSYDVKNEGQDGSVITVNAKEWDGRLFNTRGSMIFTSPQNSSDLPTCTMEISEKGIGIAGALTGFLLRTIVKSKWYKSTVHDRL